MWGGGGVAWIKLLRREVAVPTPASGTTLTGPWCHSYTGYRVGAAFGRVVVIASA